MKAKTMKDLQPMTLKSLQQILDVYGADLSRMPEALASKVKTFTQEQKAAQSLFAETLALDKTLNQFNDQSEAASNFDIAALEKKYMAKIAALPAALPMATSTDNQTNKIIKFNIEKQAPKQQTAPSIANDNHKARYLASGLLVASLLFGLVFGALGGANLFLEDASPLLLASNDMADDILYLDVGINFTE